MIAFYKLWDKMNRMGIRKKDLKDKKIVSGATINKMKNNEIVTTESIDKLCEFFQCQPEEILEFIPNSQTDKQDKNWSSTYEQKARVITLSGKHENNKNIRGLLYVWKIQN